jgi:hypothetical protein
MPSVFSNEIAGTLTPGPTAPVLLKVVGDGQTAKVSVQLPTLGEDGKPLAALTAVNVFYKTSSMVGSTPAIEVADGTPFVSVPLTVEQAGQIVEVDIPGLTYGTEYFFDADVDG